MMQDKKDMEMEEWIIDPVKLTEQEDPELYHRVLVCHKLSILRL